MKKNEDVLKILGEFEIAQEERLQESESKLLKTEYYEEFEINEIAFKKIYITTEEDPMGNVTRNVYCRGKDGWIEILTVDSEGNIHISDPELAKNLGIVNLENAIEKNDGKLKGISEIAESEEMEKSLKDEEKSREEQVQKDLSEDGRQDLNISYYREITDDNFAKQMKKDLSGYQEIGLAYSKTDNAFVLVGEKNGKFEKIEGFQEAKPTFKSVISIDEKGEQVEKKVPHALMKTDNSKKEVSVTIGQYGYIEVGTIDRLPSNDRVERQVGEDGEGEGLTQQGGREEREFTRNVRAEGEEYAVRNWAEDNEKSNKNMQIGDKEQDNLKEEMNRGIDEDALIRDAAENRAKVSEKEFRGILETIPKNEGTIEERIDRAVEKVEEQYRETNRK